MYEMPLSVDELWQKIRGEAHGLVEHEPLLASFFHATIIGHSDLRGALSFLLASKLADEVVSAVALREIIEQAYGAESELIEAACADIQAVCTRDPAVEHYSTVLLYLKGFQAIQAYRVAHWMWLQGRRSLALYIQSRVSTIFQVDIHPAAIIGFGVMFDHATGIVVGETCVIENDVSILQSVTLGGTGKESGDRHPKIRKGVMIGAGSKILGNIEVGECARVGAGSVVLSPVPPHTTVVGVPAAVVGCAGCDTPALDMDQTIQKSEPECSGDKSSADARCNRKQA
ncbi:Serine acetyltransferase [Marinobacterium lacunae]|uniref:Serine acetyltransferase n=1 Tax=Marinobacterium lacunae TaxID=1232683 RepID=A0A081G2H7_9GAMM|nr:serine O-acetyltransferase [Marinobacterium lacunae]KEA64982.1 Serine acetyltransferase [Marinobacterium lacunae]